LSSQWSGRHVAAALGGAAFVGIVTTLALRQLGWPWFSLWIAILIIIALLPLAPGVRGNVRYRREISLGLVLLGVLFFNLHLYYIESIVQTPDRLDVVGVYFDRRDTVRIGVGVSGLDVRLSGDEYDMDRWSVRVVREGEGFRVERPSGVDMLFVRGAPFGGLSRFFVASTPTRAFAYGVPLGRGDPPVVARSPGGAAHPISLQEERGRDVLTWGAGRARLWRGDEILDERLQRRLRMGIPLAELPWNIVADTGAAGDLVLVMHERWGGRRSYRLVSREGRLRLASPANERSALLGEADTIWVASRGRMWAFSLASAYDLSSTQLPALTVGFVRNPRPRGWPLMPDVDCASASCRTLVSSHPLPPPQAHFDFSGFGLDTARFSLLGRLEDGEGGFRLVTADSQMVLTRNTLVPVPVHALSAATPGAGYLLKVDHPAGSRLLRVVLTLVCLVALLLLALLAVKENPGVRRSAAADSPSADAAWVLLSLFTIFLGVRFLLGFRVAYAPPFYDRAAASAVGIWIVFSLLLLGLGLWPVVGPHLHRGGHGLLARGGLGRPSAYYGYGSMGAPDPLTWQTLAPVGGMVVLLGMLGLLGHAGVVFSAGVVAVLVLSTWLLVASIGRHISEAGLAAHPFASITADSFARERRLAMATAGSILAGLALIALMFPTAARFAIAGGVMVLGARDLLRGGWRTSIFRDVRWWLRAAGWIAAAVATFALVRLPEGPTLRFLFAFVVFLLGLRAGVAAGTRADQDRDNPGWLLLGVPWYLLAAPLVVLVPLAVFDFGLGLVFFVPLLVTVVLAAGVPPMNARQTAVSLLILVLGSFMVTSVLWPDADGLQKQAPPHRWAREFDGVGNTLVDAVRAVPGASTSIRRATVRSIAATDPELLERALANAGRSRSQEEAVRALEQVWGGRAYAAQEWMGEGFAGTEVFDRGIPAATSYAENTFSVYVLSEHGALGGLLVLALYMALLIVVTVWMWRTRNTPPSPPRRTAVAVAVGGVLWIVLPGLYVAASNLGMVPLTGQNMPFLGLNAWSDVVLVSALSASMLAALIYLAPEEA
jgi:cell division protein FtsW (lipid II flippase)